MVSVTEAIDPIYEQNYFLVIRRIIFQKNFNNKFFVYFYYTFNNESKYKINLELRNSDLKKKESTMYQLEGVSP